MTPLELAVTRLSTFIAAHHATQNGSGSYNNTISAYDALIDPEVDGSNLDAFDAFCSDIEVVHSFAKLAFPNEA